MSHTAAIVQARMGSTRYPGKIMRSIGDKTMLERVMSRLKQASTLDDVIIATTTLSQDDTICESCEQNGWTYSRGDESDVLDRYYQAAREHNVELVVRVTSDCPLIDADLVDEVVNALQDDPDLDYASNIFPKRTFPRGLDVEAFRFKTLGRLWRDTDDVAMREHVTAFLHRHAESYRLFNLVHENNLGDVRWTVDTRDDMRAVRSLYEHMGSDTFSWKAAFDAWAAHPEWADMNRNIQQKPIP